MLAVLATVPTVTQNSIPFAWFMWFKTVAMSFIISWPTFTVLSVALCLQWNNGPYSTVDGRRLIAVANRLRALVLGGVHWTVASRAVFSDECLNLVNCDPYHSTGKHCKMNTFIPDWTLRCIFFVLNVQINIIKICIKISSCISCAFQPPPTLLPNELTLRRVRWTLATPSTDLPAHSAGNQTAHSGPVSSRPLSTLAYTVNCPCNSGREISRLLHRWDCGLCEHSLCPVAHLCNNLLSFHCDTNILRMSTAKVWYLCHSCKKLQQTMARI